MAMGKRLRRARQKTMWVASADLPQIAGHPFYQRLNQVLDDAGFDAFVEPQCARFYADGVGRPSLAPGRYFRLLLLGYFEGLDSERAIAWRAAACAGPALGGGLLGGSSQPGWGSSPASIPVPGGTACSASANAVTRTYGHY